MVVEVVVEHQYRYPHISLKVRSCTAGERAIINSLVKQAVL